jgi:uncharacterized membrane protein
MHQAGVADFTMLLVRVVLLLLVVVQMGLLHLQQRLMQHQTQVAGVVGVEI